MRQPFSWPAALLAATLLVGCGRRPASFPRDTVALVGGRAITRADLDRQLQRLPPGLRSEYAPPERRRDLLEMLVGTELLALEAERLDLHRDPEYQQAIKQQLVRQLVQYVVDPASTGGAISDAQVERHYRAHLAELTRDSVTPPLEQVKEQIRQRLAHEARGQRMQALLAETRSRFGVEILDPGLRVPAAVPEMASAGPPRPDR
jgi:predicted small lipoprotein YifL